MCQEFFSQLNETLTLCDEICLACEFKHDTEVESALAATEPVAPVLEAPIGESAEFEVGAGEAPVVEITVTETAAPEEVKGE